MSGSNPSPCSSTNDPRHLLSDERQDQVVTLGFGSGFAGALVSDVAWITGF